MAKSSVVIAVVAAVVASAAAGGPVPPRLAGLWAATLVDYPRVGLYKGRYELKFGPGSEMRYIVPHEGEAPQAVSVNGARITFMRGGVCAASGTYIWTVNGRTLTFEKVADRCAKRVVQLVRRWTRVR